MLFDPPIDPDGVQAATGFTYSPQAYAGPERHVWKREGDAFETLTLTPSIDASAHGHWHGFITNGEVTC